MSSPSESDEGYNWTEVAPNVRDQEEIARQVRLMFAAGKGVPEVRSWLQQVGFSPEDAEGFLREFPQANRRISTARLCGGVGLVLGGLISASVTLLFRPWTAAWIVARPGTHGGGAVEAVPLDPIIAVGFWCGGLLAFTLICGFMGMIFGEVVGRIRRRHIG